MKKLIALTVLTVLVLTGLMIASEEIHTFIPDGGKLPKIVDKVEPMIDPNDVAEPYYGKVFLKIALNTDGKIMDEKIEVVKNGSENDVVAKAAVDAVKKYKFTAAEIDGKAVNYWIMVPVDFSKSWNKAKTE